MLVRWFTYVHARVGLHVYTHQQLTHTHTHTVQTRHTRDATSPSISHVSVCTPNQAVALKLLIIYARAEIASPRFTTSNVNVFIGKLWIFFLTLLHQGDKTKTLILPLLLSHGVVLVFQIIRKLCVHVCDRSFYPDFVH